MKVRLTKTAPQRAIAQLEALLAGMILTASSTYAATICPLLWTQAQLQADLQNRVLITGLVDRWYAEKGAWPSSDLSDIEADETFLAGDLPRSPVTGMPYRLDPVSHRLQP